MVLRDLRREFFRWLRPAAPDAPRLRGDLSALSCLLTLTTLSGCGVFSDRPGRLVAESITETPVRFEREFSTAASWSGSGQTSVYLTDIALDKLRRPLAVDGVFVHIDILWTPMPGLTAIDESAINASIRYVVFADGEVGVYAGGGFVEPNGPLTGRVISGTIEQASLRLLEHTEGFADLLTPASLRGSFSARVDQTAARHLSWAASQRVTNALGQSRYVQVDPKRKPQLRQWLSMR